MDEEVLSAVIQRTVDHCELRAGWLEGYKRVYAKDRDYPIIVTADAGARLPGFVFEPADHHERLLNHEFEGDEYRIVEMNVCLKRAARETVQLYWPTAALMPTSATWICEDWQKKHKAAYLRQFTDNDG